MLVMRLSVTAKIRRSAASSFSAASPALVVGVGQDLRGRQDRLPQQHLLLDDVRVVLDARGRGDRFDDPLEVLRPADGVQLVAPFELVPHEQAVDAFAAVLFIES